jgi:hypothetical protein
VVAITRSCLATVMGGIIFPLLSGCGDGRPSRVPISGQVLIDGQPLKHGFVTFVPTGARASVGKLDDQGRFTLGCFEQADGAVVGLHRVQVAAGELLSETRTRWHAPKKYADFKTSGLEKEVSESTDTLQIELTWDGGKPFVEIDSDTEVEVSPRMKQSTKSGG